MSAVRYAIDPMHPAPPPVVAGRYLVHGEIGHGGCASVFAGVDSRLGRPVAIKIARPSSLDGASGARLAREARAAAAVAHPNVCSVSDTGALEDGRPFLVMERLHGETLTSFISRSGPLAPDVAIDIALQLLSALDASHRVGIVHRDVKPDNVFLVHRSGCGPTVKLLDFGLCRINAPQLQDDIHLTRAGQVVGTPEYMAPEQVYGSRAFDGRIDVYASGVILYEMLTARRAFTGKDVRAVVRAVLATPPPPLATLRPDLANGGLAEVVGRAMASERGIRYQSAAHFQRDLVVVANALHAVRGPGLRACPTEPEPALTAEDLFDLDAGAWDAPTRPGRDAIPRTTRFR